MRRKRERRVGGSIVFAANAPWCTLAVYSFVCSTPAPASSVARRHGLRWLREHNLPAPGICAAVPPRRFAPPSRRVADGTGAGTADAATRSHLTVSFARDGLPRRRHGPRATEPEPVMRKWHGALGLQAKPEPEPEPEPGTLAGRSMETWTVDETVQWVEGVLGLTSADATESAKLRELFEEEEVDGEDFDHQGKAAEEAAQGSAVRRGRGGGSHAAAAESERGIA